MPLVLTQNELTESGHDYGDVLGEVYEYPRRYRNLIHTGERFVYYRGRRRASGGDQPQAYIATGVVGRITEVSGGLFQCTIERFRAFGRPVSFKVGGRYREPGAEKFGPKAGLYFRQGVRPISHETFASIVSAGETSTAGVGASGRPTDDRRPAGPSSTATPGSAMQSAPRPREMPTMNPPGTKRFNEWAAEVDKFPMAKAFIRDVHQTRDGSMVFATMTPAAMAQLLFVSDWTISDQDSPSPDKRGYQRPIKSARLGEIARYMVEHNEQDRLRMPPVILSVRHVPKDKRETFLHLLTGGSIDQIHEMFGPRAVCIVDGQHRAGGGFAAIVRTAGDFDAPIPVVLYYDLSYETEAEWFNTINSTAQPIPKSLLEWTRADITEAGQDTTGQKIRVITQRLATEANAPFVGQVSFAGGRLPGRSITFEGLRRSTADFFGGPKARLLQRLEEHHIDPYHFARDYWAAVVEACSEAWEADPKGQPRYRIRELVAIGALAKLGNTLTEQAIIQGFAGPRTRNYVLEKASRLSTVDWTKDDGNPWMRAQAGFAGRESLYEILKDWVLLGKQPT